jgi:hypothetical protein
MRESRIYVAAVIAVAAFAWYLSVQTGDDPPGLRTRPTQTASPVLAAATSRPTPTDRPLPLDGQAWFLDFAQSGISDAVAGCDQCSLGSRLTFQDGHVSGITGALGGCDRFGGSYFAGTAPAYLIDIAIPDVVADNCYPRRVGEIHRRLRLASVYGVRGCADSRTCELTLRDREGGTLLVYRLDEP